MKKGLVIMGAAAANSNGGTAKMTKLPDHVFQTVILEGEQSSVDQQAERFRIGSFHDRTEDHTVLAAIAVARILLSRQCRFRLIVMLEEEMAAKVSSQLRNENDSQQLQQVIEVKVIAEGGSHFRKLDVCLWTGIVVDPLSILKGMAEGVPWIAVGQTDVMELLFGKDGDKHGPAGFVVPADAADMITDYCEWFIKHPDIRRQFAENGRRRAMELCGI